MYLVRFEGFSISIHAPRVGRDILVLLRVVGVCLISIHAPRVGRDVTVRVRTVTAMAFQSTRPVWGATQIICDILLAHLFQSTRPVWGATA